MNFTERESTAATLCSDVVGTPLTEIQNAGELSTQPRHATEQSLDVEPGDSTAGTTLSV